MNRCTIVWPGEKLVKVSGIIDETTMFEDTVAKFDENVWVDFSGVTRINSCGVRQWTRAIHTSAARIHYVNCPALIVDQFSMVPEFLGPNSEVETFEARYACESCGNEDILLLQVGKDVIPGQEEYLDGPEHKCSKCGSQMEFDHNPEVYLDFLREMKKNAA
jgi:hypothetical protein